MLIISCAQAKLEKYREQDLSEIARRRAYAGSIIRKTSSVEDPESFINLDRIIIESLLFDRRFVEAVVYVREIREEGRLPNSDYWEKEIDMAIIRSGMDVSKIRNEASRVSDDIFPGRQD
jgi:hypothetical protein